MKAVIYRKYGSAEVLEIVDIEKPVPQDTEVLIKVYATTVNPIDWHFRSGKPFLARKMAGGFLRPKIKILGFDLAGEVESVGNKVQQFREGDQVYGRIPPGFNGANAEYVCVPENEIIFKPPKITFGQAAAVPTAATIALRFLKTSGMQSGQRILINGASGGVGTFAVQIAKYLGGNVSAVCSTANLDLVRTLGADEVIDYTKNNFQEMEQTYDIIFDVVGNKTFPDCKGALNPDGVYISTIMTFRILLYMLWTSVFGSKKARFAIPEITIDDLKFVDRLIQAEEVRPVIDRYFNLAQLADAHRYSETGHARGKIIVRVSDKN